MPRADPPRAGVSNPSKRTQHSTVKLVGRRIGESGIWTNPFVPSKVKVWPMNPAAVALAAPDKVPLFVPTRAVVFPSPGHQSMIPLGGETQVAACESGVAKR